MKKLLYIMSLLAVLFLTGCGLTEAENDLHSGKNSAFHGDFSEMAELHIELDEMPGDEYSEACVSAEWTGGNVVKKKVQIKLRGNSGKESDKKPFNIKFEEDVEFLGMDAGKKWALVANPFDKSLLRPVIGFAYAEALGIRYTPDAILCKVWVGDRYMGVYTVIEPVEAGKGRVEIDTENGDFLLERNVGRFEEDQVYIDSPAGFRFEFNEPEEPDEEQQEQCRQMLQQAEEAVFTSDHKEYSKYIDIGSFVNFYIFNEMIKDVDFGQYSTRYYFKEGIMYAGPPWDLDLTMGNVSDEKDEFKYSSYNNADGAGDGSGDSTREMWARYEDYYYWLCKDPWFNSMVEQRWRAVSAITENLTRDNELGVNLIDRYLAVHCDSLESNYSEAGWDVGAVEHMTEWQEPAGNYIENVEMLRTWLIHRKLYLDAQFGRGINAGLL